MVKEAVVKELSGKRMIVVNLDMMMAKWKISLGELAERIDITPANLSIFKTGKAKAVRFSTLERLCQVLDCQPADLLEFRPDEPQKETTKEQ